MKGNARLCDDPDDQCDGPVYECDEQLHCDDDQDDFSLIRSRPSGDNNQENDDNKENTCMSKDEDRKTGLNTKS